MTTEPLLTIGSFARAVGLTPSALRHYDDCGLLTPAATDPATGYRYYTPDLVRRARMVAAMRDAGVPIDTMRVVLDATAEVARKVLRELVEARAERAAKDEAALATVVDALESVERHTPPAVVRLEGPVLAGALRQVRPAADGDPASALSSILVDVVADSVDVVATNRFWMAVRTVPGSGTGGARVVLPLAVAARLADALDTHGEVTVEVAEDGLVLDGETYAGRDLPYPAHRLVLDGIEVPTTTAVLSASALSEAVGATGRAEVTLAVVDGVARVGPDRVGRAVTGPDLSLLLGSALLLRGLSACLGPDVVLEATEPARPVRLRSPYQPGFLALVMPIRPE